MYLVLIGAAVSFIGSLFLYLLKTVNQRLRSLEESSFSKKEVRQLVDDKIGGIHSDLQDIKAKIDKLFDIYIENRLGRNGSSR